MPIIPTIQIVSRETFFLILLSFFISFIIAPFLISLLYKFNIKMKTTLIAGVNDEYIKIHGSKVGTPTMGGIIIGIGVLVSVYVASKIYSNPTTLGYSLPFLLFFILGFIDDITAYGRKLNAKAAIFVDSLIFKLGKLIAMFALTYFSFIYALQVYNINSLSFSPFDFSIPITPLVLIPLTIFVIYLIYGLEITDGADGLFTGNVLITLFGIMAILTTVGHLLASKGSVEITMITAMIGALLAYLYYNIKPARIFMGASGTYPVAICMILITFLNGLIIPFLILGSFYWIVVSSSALQIFWIRVFKKKLFTIAPIHHWLEARFGWEETKVVERSWWFTAIVTMIGILIATL